MTFRSRLRRYLTRKQLEEQLASVQAEMQWLIRVEIEDAERA